MTPSVRIEQIAREICMERDGVLHADPKRWVDSHWVESLPEATVAFLDEQKDFIML